MSAPGNQAVGVDLTAASDIARRAASAAAAANVMQWASVCALDDILPCTGVCALVAGRQVALFRLGESVYALDNHDPASGANVLSRGIVGDIRGELVVASPLYKHHYSLTTGRCLEDATKCVNIYPVRI